MRRVLKACAVSLLGAVVFVAVTGASGDSPLTKAVKANDVQAVRALLKSAPT